MEQNHNLINTVLSMARSGPHDRILDLYCGMGNFSLPLSLHAGEVTGLEGQGSGIRSAKRNVTLNKKLLQKPAVKLSGKHKRLICDEIYETAKSMGQPILAVAVCSNHVHIVVGKIDEQIDIVVHQYKHNTVGAMKKSGVEGKVWAKGYDKRFCYDEKSLQARIEYVERHCEE